MAPQPARCREPEQPPAAPFNSALTLKYVSLKTGKNGDNENNSLNVSVDLMFISKHFTDVLFRTVLGAFSGAW